MLHSRLVSGADHELNERLDRVARDASDLRRQRTLLYTGGAVVALGAVAPVALGVASTAFLAVGALGAVLPVGGLAGRGGPLAVARARRDRDTGLRDAIQRVDGVGAELLIARGAQIEADRPKRVAWLVAQLEVLIGDPRLRNAVDSVWFELRPLMAAQPQLAASVVNGIAAIGDRHNDASAREALFDVMKSAGIDPNSESGRQIYEVGKRWGLDIHSLHTHNPSDIEPDVAAPPPPPRIRRVVAPPARTVDDAIAKMVNNDDANGLLAVGELRSLITDDPTNARRLLEHANDTFITLRDEHDRAGDAHVLAGVVVKALGVLATAEPANAPQHQALAAQWQVLTRPTSRPPLGR